MSHYEVDWAASGTATVEADSQDEAMDYVLDAIDAMNFDDLDRIDASGVEILGAMEV